MSEFLPGLLNNRCRDVALLGRGGLGAVYLADGAEPAFTLHLTMFGCMP
jgi:hypothetical protein